MSQNKYLSFCLSTEVNAMIDASQVREIVYVEHASIMPVFEMVSAIMGVFNLRGEFIWLVDLAFLFGFQPLSSQNNIQNYSVLVVKKDYQYIGIACQKVGNLFLSEDLRTTYQIDDNISKNLKLCIKNKKNTPYGNDFWNLNFSQILKLLNN